MAETAVRRIRRAARGTGTVDRAVDRETDRVNAAAALQRALDRRDNGGVTGH
ncbi:hypothetical protein [Streptomyces sp. ISL-11]|uniref:hypothetical protein n=1 Tax=Streptomyces sp. ISL-11 TaxID=2819174 RepID=UPI001BE535F5|nr:hypothetical protein [Streptomyces sp. ISL-11]MBT2386336.1 hypothetical protein [Streptomyces sp. ISL-11]